MKITTFAIFLFCAVLTAGDQWPDFRGPRGDGTSDVANLPLVWSESQNVKWKTLIHDRGLSSPVLWDDKIWLTTATADGHKFYVVCVNLADGKIVHDILLFKEPNPQRIHSFNSYATPPVLEKDGKCRV